MPADFYRKYGKRIFDFLLAVFAIIIFSPLFLILIITIRLIDGRPVFFRQIRMGKDFTKFTMFKFRTMIDNADKNGPLVTSSADRRISKTGRWLRRFKLDEFPQLFNVLRGDISFVGPRPEMEKFVNYYKDEYQKVLSVYPGITDDAALQYRNEAELLKNAQDVEAVYIQKVLPIKIALYLKYIERMTFKNDLRLIGKTMMEIFR